MSLKSVTSDDETRGLILYRAIWRWHFYAGLFCLPFILILAKRQPVLRLGAP